MCEPSLQRDGGTTSSTATGCATCGLRPTPTTPWKVKRLGQTSRLCPPAAPESPAAGPILPRERSSKVSVVDPGPLIPGPPLSFCPAQRGWPRRSVAGGAASSKGPLITGRSFTRGGSSLWPYVVPATDKSAIRVLRRASAVVSPSITLRAAHLGRSLSRGAALSSCAHARGPGRTAGASIRDRPKRGTDWGVRWKNEDEP